MIEFEEDGQEAEEEGTTFEVAELKRIYRHVHAVLENMLAVSPGIDASTPAAVIAKLSELQIAHRRIVVAEEAFNADYPPSVSDTELDLSTIRAEIGGQLDRIREVITTERIPGETELCPTCGAALSL